MRWRLPTAAVLACLVCGQVAPAVRAQESPLVPPWGRDLEVELSPAMTEELSGDHAEGSQRRPWRFAADYWLAWTKNDRIPALLTTGPTSDPRPGALGNEFTRIQYGDAVDYEDRSGGRFTLEIPFGSSGNWSAAASYYLLDSRHVGPRFASPGSPVLARPFFDAVGGVEDSSLVTYPGVASGAIDIRSNSFLQGAEANLRGVAYRYEHGQVALVAGLRYLSLDESLLIAETSQLSAGALPFPGRTARVADRFEADNDFFGGQVGLQAEWTYHRFTFGVTSLVALGNVHETVTIRGRTTIDTTPAIDEPAGLLALATNSGKFSRDRFAVVPEVSAKLGVRITDRLTISAGYMFLYWNSVVRPGDQIDRNLNPHLIPTSATYGDPGGPRQPARLFRNNDYWAQGMTVGLEFRY